MKEVRFDGIDSCTQKTMATKEIELHNFCGTWKPTREQLDELIAGGRLAIRVCAEGEIHFVDMYLQECVYQ